MPFARRAFFADIVGDLKHAFLYFCLMQIARGSFDFVLHFLTDSILNFNYKKNAINEIEGFFDVAIAMNTWYLK